MTGWRKIGHALLNDEAAAAHAKQLFLTLCDWNSEGPCSLEGPWGDEVGLSHARCFPAVFDLLYDVLSENERVEYIVRNSEILRKYMVNLIDEDVKARGPYRRAIKEGDPRKIEAASQSAGAVCSEIVCMMEKALELAEELAALCPDDARHFIAESADLALAAIRASMRYCVYWGDQSMEDTRRYVIRRENELQWEEIQALYKRVIEKAES